MVFGKKKEAAAKEAAAKEAAKKTAEEKKPVTTAVAKEEPKKEAKHDLAAKLREQKAKRDAEEKGNVPEEKVSHNNESNDTKPKTTNGAKPTVQQNAAIDKDWDAKLKEIMKETGEDASAPRPKAKVVIKPDGTKAYVYDNAYGTSLSADDRNNAQKNDQSSKKQSDEPVKKQSKPLASTEDVDEMKGFDDFYKWIKNGQMADIRDCEKVMFGKK